MAQIGCLAYHLDMPGTLIVLRHGQSTWNQLNLFTGWHDVPLTPQGIAEAKAAGVTLRQAGMKFGAVHTSLLVRAIDTTQLVLHEMGQDSLPVAKLGYSMNVTTGRCKDSIKRQPPNYMALSRH